MRKMMLMAFVASVVALMLAASPASANEHWDDDDCRLLWNGFRWVLVCDDDFDDFDDSVLFFDDFDDGFFDDGFGEFGDVESGAITQDTTITSSGDNSNQAAPVLNAANTGNVVNGQFVGLFGSDVDDIEFDDGGSIEVSPNLTFSADQSIQQAAAAG